MWLGLDAAAGPGGLYLHGDMSRECVGSLAGVVIPFCGIFIFALEARVASEDIVKVEGVSVLRTNGCGAELPAVGRDWRSSVTENQNQKKKKKEQPSRSNRPRIPATFVIVTPGLSGCSRGCLDFPVDACWYGT